MDKELAGQAGVELEKLSMPLCATALDGRLIAKITHHTHPVIINLSGNHQEVIQFNIITAPDTPLVLGYPWLKIHNPHKP